MADKELLVAAETVLNLCKSKKLTLATAESCTGGLVAAALSEIPGSSLVLDRGFVTYSNEAKQQMLGVTPATIDVYGAVSTACAEEMAKGALAHASVDLAISITGIAGPTGAVRGKPIGLVYFCAASRSGRVIAHYRKYGDIGRANVRRECVLQALAMLQELAEKEEPRPPGGKASGRIFHPPSARRLRQNAGRPCRTLRPSASQASGFEFVVYKEFNVADLGFDRIKCPTILHPLERTVQIFDQNRQVCRSSVTRLVNVSRMTL